MNECRVPELYWKGRDVSALNLKEMPEHYVIRRTIGFSSKLVFVMSGGQNLMDQQTYAKEQILEKLEEALAQDDRLEFLVEEFLKTEKGMSCLLGRNEEGCTQAKQSIRHFARMDFYATDKGAVFGEFTPTPFMGTNFTPAGEQMLVANWDKYYKGMV